MIVSVIIYLIGCLISYVLGLNIVNKIQSIEKPIFEKSDMDDKIAIKQMSLFIMFISSWLGVAILLFFRNTKGFKLLTKN